jgi:hypothetical protein
MTLRWPALAVVLTLLLGTGAHADPVCDHAFFGQCGTSSLALQGTLYAIDASFAVGGVVALIGGANDLGRGRAGRGWRIGNYVFGALNFGAAVMWGSFAIANVSPGFTGPLAIPHFAIGTGDIIVGLVSSSRVAPPLAFSLRPIASRDLGGHALTGVALQITGF